jgi:acyl-CoA dehydrogenase
MNALEPTQRATDLRKRLEAFMAEHIYPNEGEWAAQITANRWQPTRIMEVLKLKARAAGL